MVTVTANCILVAEFELTTAEVAQFGGQLFDQAERATRLALVAQTPQFPAFSRVFGASVARA